MGHQTYDGNLKVTFVATITAPTGPAATELNAGTDLQADITPDGFGEAFDNAMVDTSALASTFDSEQVGRSKPNITITFMTLNDDGTPTDAATTLTYRASGFLVVRRNAAEDTDYAAADIVTVYAVEVHRPAPATAAPNETQKATVQLASTTDPNIDVTVT